MGEWRHAPEVEAIAELLIESEERHHDLGRVRIEYVFIESAPRSRGRLVWGRARKMSGLAAFFAAPPKSRPKMFHTPSAFFVIEIAHDVWLSLTDVQRRALVDHELCHCTVDEDEFGVPVLGTRGHDVEEFSSVVRRYGPWSLQVERFAAAVSSHVADGLVELEQHANTDDGSDGA